MTTTARLGFTLWETGQIQPNTVYNDLAAKVDLWLTSGVKSRTTDAQPGSPVPAEGDAYIMTASASGAAWGAFTENYIAYYIDGTWTQYAPPGRIITYVDDENLAVVWNGTAWSVAWQPIKHNFSASAAPAATDDASQGYGVGSQWIDVNSSPRTMWVCIEATTTSPASATWVQLI